MARMYQLVVDRHGTIFTVVGTGERRPTAENIRLKVSMTKEHIEVRKSRIKKYRERAEKELPLYDNI